MQEKNVFVEIQNNYNNFLFLAYILKRVNDLIRIMKKYIKII